MQTRTRGTAATMRHSPSIPLNDSGLCGTLEVPVAARGLVLFAHGSGSSRLSPRNAYMAQCLRDAQLGTLLFDLLTAEEDSIDHTTRAFRFDIPLLTGRLLTATKWIVSQPALSKLPLGYFGASTGAAAALCAAACLPAVAAVVSRGGRPDLAGSALQQLAAPTLLIVGGSDRDVLQLNRRALARMRCEKRLEIVPGATHLFEEAGALEQVALLASDWFLRHLDRPSPRQS